MRDNMAAHVNRLIGVYHAKRDRDAEGARRVLQGTDATISRPAADSFSGSACPSGTDKQRLAERAVQAAYPVQRRAPCSTPTAAQGYIRLAFSTSSRTSATRRAAACEAMLSV